jgi:hypothetical protein
LLDGGRERTERRRYIRSLVDAHPLLAAHGRAMRDAASHTELYLEGLRTAVAMRDIVLTHGLHEPTDRRYLKVDTA